MRAMDEQMLRAVSTLTLDKDSGWAPGPTDLPSLWRLTPPEEPSSRFPGYSARMELLRTYIIWSHTKPWAMEGLRNLLREFLDNREPVPELLSLWALRQYARGDPKPKWGRPEEADRDSLVWDVFTMLRKHAYSRQAAFNFIAEKIGYEPETVRSVIRKRERERRPPKASKKNGRE